MNREFYSNQARRDAIVAAKTAHRPLSIWELDQFHIGLQDLPDVSRDYYEEHSPEAEFTFRRGEGKFTPEVGKRYGIVRESFTVQDGRTVVVGQWK